MTRRERAASERRALLREAAGPTVRAVPPAEAMPSAAHGGALPAGLALVPARSAAQLVPSAAPVAPVLEASELWIAIHLPSLQLDALRGLRERTLSPVEPATTSEAANAPLALVEAQRGVQRVIAVDVQARERGIQPGMSLAAALASCPRLEVREREPRREALLLSKLAESLLSFTPRVSLEPPDAVLLEVRGSLMLFGGLESLVHAIFGRSASLGAGLQLAMAPTPLAALALARLARFAPCSASQGPSSPLGPASSRASTPRSTSVPTPSSTSAPASSPSLPSVMPVVTDLQHLVGALAPVPLSALRWPLERQQRLAAMGVRTIGEALRLPRAGYARRFGREALAALDRLVGRSPDLRKPFTSREWFRGRCEPEHEICDHATLLRYVMPLLEDLERFLRRRQQATTGLLLRLRHRRDAAVAPTMIPLQLAAPELQAAAFAALLGEHLARTQLAAPVIRLELRSGALQRLVPQTSSLWRLGEHGGAAGREATTLIERLRARLGSEAVYGLCLVPEHRPERAWRIAEPLTCMDGRASRSRQSRGAIAWPRREPRSSASSGRLRRPLWLLRQPEALGNGASGLILLNGPERIETGWWDGADVMRDYYVARDASGAQLWVFRERRPPHRWFVQGIFG